MCLSILCSAGAGLGGMEVKERTEGDRAKSYKTLSQSERRCSSRKEQVLADASSVIRAYARQGYHVSLGLSVES